MNSQSSMKQTKFKSLLLSKDVDKIIECSTLINGNQKQMHELVRFITNEKVHIQINQIHGLSQITRQQKALNPNDLYIRSHLIYQLINEGQAIEAYNETFELAGFSEDDLLRNQNIVVPLFQFVEENFDMFREISVPDQCDLLLKLSKYITPQFKAFFKQPFHPDFEILLSTQHKYHDQVRSMMKSKNGYQNNELVGIQWFNDLQFNIKLYPPPSYISPQIMAKVTQLFSLEIESNQYRLIMNGFANGQIFKMIRAKCVAQEDYARYLQRIYYLTIALEPGQPYDNYRLLLQNTIINIQAFKKQKVDITSAQQDNIMPIHLFKLVVAFLQFQYLDAAQNLCLYMHVLKYNIDIDYELTKILDIGYTPVIQLIQNFDIPFALKSKINKYFIQKSNQNLSRDQELKSLICTITEKNDRQFLIDNLDRLFELHCPQNIEEDECRNYIYFIETLMKFQHLDIPTNVIAGYFEIDTPQTMDDLYLQVLKLIQQREQSLGNQILVISKLLYFINKLAQRQKDRGLSFQYFQQSVKLIKSLVDQFPRFRSLNDIIHYKISEELANDLDLLHIISSIKVIDRFCTFYQLEIKTYKVLLLYLEPSITDLQLCELSANIEEYKVLKIQFKTAIPKKGSMLKFLTKMALARLENLPIKLKKINNTPQSISRGCHRILYNFKQQDIPTAFKLYILEQLHAYLTVLILRNIKCKKFVDELLNQDIPLFNDDIYCSNFDNLILYAKVMRQIIKALNQLGFYKSLKNTFKHSEPFLIRSLQMTNLIRIYCHSHWLIEQWPSFVDQVTSCARNVSNLRITENRGQESLRQSLHRSSLHRKSSQLQANLIDIIKQLNIDELIFQGKFSTSFKKCLLLYLSEQSQNRPRLYERLYCQSKPSYILNQQCPSAIKLFQCKNVKLYNEPIHYGLHFINYDKYLIDIVIPLKALSLRQQQPSMNYIVQFAQIIEAVLIQSMKQSLQRATLYFHLYQLVNEMIGDEEIHYEESCQCDNPPNRSQIELLGNLVGFQLTQKQWYLDFNINLQDWDCRIPNVELPIHTHQTKQKDLAIIYFQEFDSQTTMYIGRCYEGMHSEMVLRDQKQLYNFKRTMITYLEWIKQNIDSLAEYQQQTGVKWADCRQFYEKEMLKQYLAMQKDLRKVLSFIYNTNHPFLLLSPQLQLLPWDHLSDCIFNRVLSLSHVDNLTSDPISRNSDIYYCLNPSQDLLKTQTKLTPLLQEYQGVIAQKPSADIVLEILSRNQYYFYVGHGAGQQYVTEKQILSKRFQGRPFLLGCSSVQMIEIDQFQYSNPAQSEQYLRHMDMNGLAISYLLRGASTVFGTLWPVTDRDADLYACDLLNQYKQHQEFRPEESILKLRDECQLKELNGTAFVIYGLNC